MCRRSQVLNSPVFNVAKGLVEILGNELCALPGWIKNGLSSCKSFKILSSSGTDALWVWFPVVG